MNTEPSPKAEVASLTAKFICSSKSSMRSTIRIPFPPPPALALINKGKPVAKAISFPSFKLEIAPAEPGTIGILYFFTAAFADNLSPIMFIASGDGPIKVMPACLTAAANSAFSDKNP